MVGDRTGRRATGTVRSMAARPARVAGLLLLVMSTAACGTVSVEVTSETDATRSERRAPSHRMIRRSHRRCQPRQLDHHTTTTTSTTSTSTRRPARAPRRPPHRPPRRRTDDPLEYHDTGYAVFALAGDLEVRCGQPLRDGRLPRVGSRWSVPARGGRSRRLDDLASRGRGTGSRTAPTCHPCRRAGDGTDRRHGDPGWQLHALLRSHRQLRRDRALRSPGLGAQDLSLQRVAGRGRRRGNRIRHDDRDRWPDPAVVSQVDEFTAEPSNPHVHLEVIDTSIPDRPSSGGGC